MRARAKCPNCGREVPRYRMPLSGLVYAIHFESVWKFWNMTLCEMSGEKIETVKPEELLAHQIQRRKE